MNDFESSLWDSFEDDESPDPAFIQEELTNLQEETQESLQEQIEFEKERLEGLIETFRDTTLTWYDSITNSYKVNIGKYRFEFLIQNIMIVSSPNQENPAHEDRLIFSSNAGLAHMTSQEVQEGRSTTNMNENQTFVLDSMRKFADLLYDYSQTHESQPREISLRKKDELYTKEEREELARNMLPE